MIWINEMDIWIQYSYLKYSHNLSSMPTCIYHDYYKICALISHSDNSLSEDGICWSDGRRLPASTVHPRSAEDCRLPIGLNVDLSILMYDRSEAMDSMSASWLRFTHRSCLEWGNNSVSEAQVGEAVCRGFKRRGVNPCTSPVCEQVEHIAEWGHIQWS